MRLPNDVLRRVRGAMVVVTLAACGGEPVTTPPPIAPEPPVVLAPSDPVAYDATRESMRLARLDAEDEGSSVQRETRVSNVAQARRAITQRAYARWIGARAACGRG